MHDTKPGLTRPRSLLPCQVAMHRWEAEGGALAQRATQQAPRRDLASLAPGEAVARLTQLHIRVIALENMVISLLAQASDRQLDIAREMAIFISPRCGATPHGLTIGAAVEMNSLVDRASRFRTWPAESISYSSPLHGEARLEFVVDRHTVRMELHLCAALHLWCRRGIAPDQPC